MILSMTVERTLLQWINVKAFDSLPRPSLNKHGNYCRKPFFFFCFWVSTVLYTCIFIQNPPPKWINLKNLVLFIYYWVYGKWIEEDFLRMSWLQVWKCRNQRNQQKGLKSGCRQTLTHHAVLSRFRVSFWTGYIFMHGLKHTHKTTHVSLGANLTSVHSSTQ